MHAETAWSLRKVANANYPGSWCHGWLIPKLYCRCRCRGLLLGVPNGSKVGGSCWSCPPRTKDPAASLASFRDWRHPSLFPRLPCFLLFHPQFISAVSVLSMEYECCVNAQGLHWDRLSCTSVFYRPQQNHLNEMVVCSMLIAS